MAKRYPSSRIWLLTKKVFKGIYGNRMHIELRNVIGPRARFKPREAFDSEKFSETRKRQIEDKLFSVIDAAEERMKRRHEREREHIAELREAVRFHREDCVSAAKSREMDDDWTITDILRHVGYYELEVMR